MDTLLKPLLVRGALLEKGVRIFTSRDFARIFDTTPIKTKYFLETQTERGLFMRLKNGLYSLKTDLPSEEEIANALYKPSYISFEYALAYYGIIPEMPYTVTSAATKPTRTFTVYDKVFFYHSIKKEAFTGYALIKNQDKSMLIAEPEKALVDYFYFVMLNKIPKNDRLIINVNKINKDKVFQYVSLYGNRSSKNVTDLLKTIL